MIGGLILALGTMALSLYPKSHPSHKPPSAKNATIRSSDAPSEAPIDQNVYHSTATGTEPKYVRLPSVATEGFIQKVGVDQHKEVGVPSNINLAGWFAPAAKPGQPGLSIIDGHVDGGKEAGIFHRLAQLKKGDAVEIERADGVKLQFRVFALQTAKVAEAANVLFSQAAGITSQLNLITCVGTFSSAAKGYDQRLIVSAEYIHK
jgi:LPXTG-site transpeptidase (sortase) family protein